MVTFAQRSRIKSRKMWLAVGCSLLILAGAGLAAYSPAFGANYEAYVGGQVATFLTYCGGNVGAKAAVRGNPAAAAEE